MSCGLQSALQGVGYTAVYKALYRASHLQSALEQVHLPVWTEGTQHLTRCFAGYRAHRSFQSPWQFIGCVVLTKDFVFHRFQDSLEGALWLTDHVIVCTGLCSLQGTCFVITECVLQLLILSTHSSKNGPEGIMSSTQRETTAAQGGKVTYLKPCLRHGLAPRLCRALSCPRWLPVSAGGVR